MDCRITEKGLAALRELDEPIQTLDERLLASLNKAELRSFIEMLNRIRTDNTDR